MANADSRFHKSPAALRRGFFVCGPAGTRVRPTKTAKERLFTSRDSARTADSAVRVKSDRRKFAFPTPSQAPLSGIGAFEDDLFTSEDARTQAPWSG